jgi:hypothetical protein
VAAGDSKNGPFEHKLLGVVDYTVVDPQDSLVFINLAKIVVLTVGRNYIKDKIPERVRRCIPNILYPAIMMAIFYR